MMDYDHILIKGCPLCDIFTEPRNLIRTKLYTPSFDWIPTSDFIIIDCNTCHTPMIVVRDHTTEITSELWGRILYKCRLLFGDNVRLRTKANSSSDHWHGHVINVKLKE